SGKQVQPSWVWLRMKAWADSRWASSELNSCSGRYANLRRGSSTSPAPEPFCGRLGGRGLLTHAFEKLVGQPLLGDGLLVQLLPSGRVAGLQVLGGLEHGVVGRILEHFPFLKLGFTHHGFPPS